MAKFGLTPWRETKVGKVRRYEFYVSGRGDFPVDMLRYDQCWPLGPTDAAMLYPTVRDHRFAAIASNTPPTPERWRSFGWVVTAYEPT